MIPIDSNRFDAIADMVGDTPFTVTPHSLLLRRTCDVYASHPIRPRCIAIIPHTPFPDVYVLLTGCEDGATSLERAELTSLVDFLGQLETPRGFVVPAILVQPICARRRICLEVEGLCFTYGRIPSDFIISRPEFARQLSIADAASVSAFPDEAAFLCENHGSPSALLSEGLAYGVFREGRLVSMGASLALTPTYCDVGVYTLPRHRNRGYATDCVQALFSQAFARGLRPLWRIGVRQKVAILFAEKLAMEEIGTDGGEVYLQVYPPC